MNEFWTNPFLRSRYLLAVLAGLLLTGAFPRVGVAGFAWLAPGLLLAAALGKRGGEAFRLGYIGGLAHYLSMLYWLLLIPYRWHGLPLGPALGWLALGAFLALFPAVWVWLIIPRNLPAPQANAGFAQSPADQIHDPSHSFSSAGVLARTWLRRTLWGLSGAAVWVALEMLLARVFGGFPWDLLGVSQYQMVPLIQVASFTGVYGVSFLVVWVSLALLSAGLTIIRRPTTRSGWVAEVFLPVLLGAILFNVGLHHLRHKVAARRDLRVTLVQPSIPQTLIWDTSRDAERFDDLVRLTERALATPTDLVIWPEAAVPSMLRYDTNIFATVTGLARRHHVWMIAGSDDAEPRPGATNLKDADYFNSSFLVSPEGVLVQRYVKRGLVMFGEYVPFQRWLPFLKYFTPVEGGFTPGTHATPFEMPDLGVTVSVLICFEDIFPHFARRDVQAGIDFLVNITNDGWFGEGAAQWQQAASAVFRTVETGRPLVRCSNNGLTCWIDEHGHVREVLRDARGSIYGPGFLCAEIPVAPRDQLAAGTFYVRHGDWFGWLCVVVTALLLCQRAIQYFRR